MNCRFIVFLSASLICLVLAVVVNVIYGIDIVYTHLFSIPIILTGIWCPRYAVFFAAALGLVYIARDGATLGAFKIGPLPGIIMFMIVAYVTSYLALRRDREKYFTESLVQTAQTIVSVLSNQHRSLSLFE